MGQSVLAADKKLLTKEESAKVIEDKIRNKSKKPKGELTKADLEKVTKLSLIDKQLTNVKGLEKFKHLRALNLENNRDLTKAEIAELMKVFKQRGQKCTIVRDPGK